LVVALPLLPMIISWHLAHLDTRGWHVTLTQSPAVSAPAFAVALAAICMAQAQSCAPPVVFPLRIATVEALSKSLAMLVMLLDASCDGGDAAPDAAAPVSAGIAPRKRAATDRHAMASETLPSLSIALARCSHHLMFTTSLLVS
jgi:hypothetical protein